MINQSVHRTGATVPAFRKAFDVEHIFPRRAEARDVRGLYDRNTTGCSEDFRRHSIRAALLWPGSLYAVEQAGPENVEREIKRVEFLTSDAVTTPLQPSGSHPVCHARLSPWCDSKSRIILDERCVANPRSPASVRSAQAD